MLGRGRCLCIQGWYVAHFNIDVSGRCGMVGGRRGLLVVDGLVGIVAVHSRRLRGNGRWSW